MIEQFAESNVVYAIGGGVVYATLFALKATQSGEPFSGTRYGITIVLAAALGFAFEVLGYRPSAYDWFALLFAFSGMIAALEQAAKLAARGYYDEARDKAGEAVQEGTEVATGFAGGQEAARREVEQRLPPGVQPADDADEQYDRAREEFGGDDDPGAVAEGVDDEERRQFLMPGSSTSESGQRSDDEVVTDGP